MTHCPQCGAIVAPGGRACSACGLVVALVPGFEPLAKSNASRTIVGGMALGPLRGELPPAPAFDPRPSRASPAPVDDMGKTLVDPPRFQPLSPHTLPSAGAGGRTLLGVEPPQHEPPFAPPAGAPGGGGRTLLGVATPGIAPLHPDRPKAAEPAAAFPGSARSAASGAAAPPAGPPAGPPGNYGQRGPGRPVSPLQELGATAVPGGALGERGGVPRKPSPGQLDQLRRALRPRDKKPPQGDRASSVQRRTRAAWLLGAALAIVVTGVLVAVFWPRSAPLSLRVAARDGVELLVLECAACPDGTMLRTAGVEASVKAGRAEAPLAAPLPVGDSVLSVAVDRPGDGRDETVSATARVLYRVRLDLATLAGKQPNIGVVVEAVPGTRITVDGVVVELQGNVGTRAIDVVGELTGASVETTTLTRKIAYTIEPPGEPAESGLLTAQVGVVPLRIDAPGPTIITDRTTFVLAGRTAPGAELTVAGHPITVKGDGAFAHVMSVSTTGATTIEVRASQEGKAPRIATVAVERVSSLEEASRRFREQKPLGHADVVGDPGAARGKAIIVSGEIMEVRRAPYQTIAVVNVTDGCKSSCLVRVVIGSDADLKAGTRATFYGQVAGAFAAGSGPSLPEIDAAFFEVKPR